MAGRRVARAEFESPARQWNPGDGGRMASVDDVAELILAREERRGKSAHQATVVANGGLRSHDRREVLNAIGSLASYIVRCSKSALHRTRSLGLTTTDKKRVIAPCARRRVRLITTERSANTAGIGKRLALLSPPTSSRLKACALRIRGYGRRR